MNTKPLEDQLAAAKAELKLLGSACDKLRTAHKTEVKELYARAEKAEAELAAEREKVRVLRDALHAISFRAPTMASRGEYRSGQYNALQACSEVASAALAETKES